MIRRTLQETKQATYSVDLPCSSMEGMPTPTGTGFFVSSDGWFITAAHVVTEDGSPTGPLRTDVDKCWLMKESRPGKFMEGMCESVRLETVLPEMDIAILKVDFAANANKDHFRGLDGFPHLTVSKRRLEEGESVYAFGYPLPKPQSLADGGHMMYGHGGIAPRTTSAIVASTMDRTLVASSGHEPQVYVLDKAFNYGNSGGPVIATETGRVHALCSRFQHVDIRQPYKTADGEDMYIRIPSLYGVVSSLSDPRVIAELAKRGVPLSDE